MCTFRQTKNIRNIKKNKKTIVKKEIINFFLLKKLFLCQIEPLNNTNTHTHIHSTNTHNSKKNINV